MDKYFAVEKILNRRIVDGIVQYRVKWLGYPNEENTWEAEDDLDCPDEIEEFLKLQSKGDTNYSNKECDSESIHMKIKEISKKNLYLDQATEKNMDIIKMTNSNCENGFKNIDHNGHENMGETTEVNTQDSQNKVIINECMDVGCGYDNIVEENKKMKDDFMQNSNVGNLNNVDFNDFLEEGHLKSPNLFLFIFFTQQFNNNQYLSMKLYDSKYYTLFKYFKNKNLNEIIFGVFL